MIIVRRLKLIGVALAVTACAPDGPGGRKVAASSQINCNGISDCDKAVGELKVADRAMVRALDHAIARIQSCKFQNTTRCAYWERGVTLVRAEQETWSAWRLAHCELFALSMVDTSAEGTLEAVCRANLAKERTGELGQMMRPEE